MFKPETEWNSPEEFKEYEILNSKKFIDNFHIFTKKGISSFDIFMNSGKTISYTIDLFRNCGELKYFKIIVFHLLCPF